MISKSTAVNAWLDSLDTDYSWLSLDESDSNLQQFLTYFIASLETNDIFKFYKISELLSSLQSIGTDGLIHSMINIFCEIQKPFVIVLDDYHLIQNTKIHEIMIKLVEYLPRHVHLVILTRQDPPFPLSKLRVSRMLLEVRVKELQFDNDETDRFMSDIMGLHMSPDNITILNAKTEGWIAGIQLAALSLKSHSDPEELIESFSGNYYIADYLLEEVLNGMERPLIDFLLITSILGQFTSDLCDALLDAEPGSSKEFIRVLSQNNTFVISLDHQRQWFRYHHLFRDLLVERLSKSSFDLKVLHDRAGRWYLNNDNIDLAIYHAFKADAMNLAADLIENIWAECDRSLQAKRWIDWFRLLPFDITEKRPVLLMGYGWSQGIIYG